MKKINIAIDGPSGAGKSTLAKLIAARLGINYVDTGAIYRTVGFAVRRAEISPDDVNGVEGLLNNIKVDVKFADGKQHMLLDGEDLGERIREHEISDYASRTSAIPAVRAFLLDTQRNIAAQNSTIMDGRDIGTVILPNADVKIFLSASAENRAKRRKLELEQRGEICDYEQILKDIKERDERDSTRAIAPLKPADDAVLLDNSALGIEETLKATLDIIYEKRPDIKL